MRRYVPSLIALLLVFVITPSAGAQSSEQDNFKQQFLQHFDYASRILSLAKAMPAESYTWQPEEGVYTVAKVYAHIARYNYYYLESSLDIPAPDNVDVENMESLINKEDVVTALEQSIEHVKTSINEMPAEKLDKMTELYGQSVNGQAVLMQLITHYSEHVGQAIAYARMNDVVPPWSR